MGVEISQAQFTEQDFIAFKLRLKQETHHLIELLNQPTSAIDPTPQALSIGFEIEACLIDKQAQPNAINPQILAMLDSPMFSPELAKFDIELNTTPQRLTANAFTHLETEIQQLLQQLDSKAQQLQSRVLLTGILPTLRHHHFSLHNMSEMKRYHALNDLILKERHNRPLHFDIAGQEELHFNQNSVMLEAAATSLQLHLKVPVAEAHHYYNASIMISAIMVAVAANSPFLFGRTLWHETRIPIFEQAIDLGRTPQRVTFGSGYVAHIQECFLENLTEFPVMLPVLQDKALEQFANLSLHNGSIWRWNRPLVGQNADGTPHIRIEHRVLPAGPTVADMMANAMLFYGLCEYFAQRFKEQSPLVDFASAKSNFYNAAKYGLQGKIHWQNQPVSIKELLLMQLLNQAESGLTSLGVDAGSIKSHLEIIRQRVQTEQTGAQWQIQHAKHCNEDMQQITQDYYQLQQTNQPVHCWPLKND